jgi:hypothetical protein
MENIFSKLKLVHEPTPAMPWIELEYADYSEFRELAQFIDSLDNLARLRQHTQPFFFRGQSNANWTLKPKLVRLLEDLPLEDALGYEFESVCYFRERAHLFHTAIAPAEEAFLEWVSLMQHFSAPTRMLDWTSSFPIALYFAVCEDPLDVPGAVWIVHAEPLWRWMGQKYPNSELLDEKKRRGIFSRHDRFVEFGMTRAQSRLDGYDPDRKSERITAQRGVFTVCERLFADHALIIGEALLAGDGSQRTLPLSKIILSPEAKRYFRLYLNKLNITAATLFPGTDGLGRTITETLRVYRETFSGRR